MSAITLILFSQTVLSQRDSSEKNEITYTFQGLIIDIYI